MDTKTAILVLGAPAILVLNAIVCIMFRRNLHSNAARYWCLPPPMGDDATPLPAEDAVPLVLVTLVPSPAPP